MAPEKTEPKKKKSAKDELPPMELWEVKDGFALHWPEDMIADATKRARGEAGYRVDMCAPLERGRFCVGQMHKLRRVDNVGAADPITEPRAIAAILEFQRAVPEAPTLADQLESEAGFEFEPDTKVDLKSLPDPTKAGKDASAEK